MQLVLLQPGRFPLSGGVGAITDLDAQPVGLVLRFGRLMSLADLSPTTFGLPSTQ